MSNVLGDTWLFSFADRRWTDVATSGADCRLGPAGCYDPAGNRLIVFGGFDGDETRNDVRALLLPKKAIGCVSGCANQVATTTKPSDLRLDPDATAQWVTLDSGTGVAPPPRAYAAAGYDGERRQLIVHGGAGGPEATLPLSDTWAFSLDRGTWQLLDGGTADCPPGRWRHASVVESEQGTFVIFGGSDDKRSYGDTWKLDLASLAWSKINDDTGTASPGEREASAALLRPARDQLVVFGGEGSSGATSDLWSMTLAEPVPGASNEAKGLDNVPLARLAVWPNPGTDEVTIRLSLPEPGPAVVAIYDVRGRLVRILSASSAPAGPNSLVWNGRDAGGNKVSSGVYFCRVATDAGHESVPMVLVR